MVKEFSAPDLEKTPEKLVFPPFEESLQGYASRDVKDTRYAIEVTQERDAQGIALGPPIRSFIRSLVMPEKKLIIEHEYALIREPSSREHITFLRYLGGQEFSSKTKELALEGRLTFEGKPWEAWERWSGEYAILPNIPKISAKGEGPQTTLVFEMADGSHKYFSVLSERLSKEAFHTQFEEEATRTF